MKVVAIKVDQGYQLAIVGDDAPCSLMLTEHVVIDPEDPNNLLRKHEYLMQQLRALFGGVMAAFGVVIKMPGDTPNGL
jgi:hypothetical protein